MASNSTLVAKRIDVDVSTLRQAIQDEYTEVASDPGKGFHFHTGRALTGIVGYEDDWLEGVAESAIESFAGKSTARRSTPSEDSPCAFQRVR